MSLRIRRATLAMLAAAAIAASTPSYAQSTLVEGKNIVVRAYPASPLSPDIADALNSFKNVKVLETSNALIVEIKWYLQAWATAEAKRTGEPSDASFCSKSRQAYLFHVAKWHVNSDATYSLVVSNWYVFHVKRAALGTNDECTLIRAKTKWSTGQPLMYGDRSALLIGITQFDNTVSLERIAVSYKVSATPAVAENITDLGTAISALTGIAAPAGGITTKEVYLVPPPPPTFTTYFKTYLSLAKIKGRERLPMDFNVTYGLSQLPQDASPPGAQNLPPAYFAVPYEARIWVQQPERNYKYMQSCGSLPPGLELNAETGVIRGTPMPGATSTSLSPCAAPPPCPQATPSTPCSPPASPATAPPCTAAPAQAPCPEAPAATATGMYKPYRFGVDVKAAASLADCKADPRPSDCVNIMTSISLSPLPTGQNANATTPQNAPMAPGKGPAGQGGKQGQNNPNAQNPGQNGGNSPQQSSTVPTVDCTATDPSTPCSFASTFHSDDHEVWDVSLGIAIPGVRESIYSPSNLTAAPSVTTHTDALALIDVYPLAHWANKEALWYPHLNFAIPVTSQPLHRPAFGLAENIATWKFLQNSGFPRISFFADVVYLKDRIPAPATSPTMLKNERVWKMVYGLEVPISAIAGAVGKGAKSAKGGSGKGGS